MTHRDRHRGELDREEEQRPVRREHDPESYESRPRRSGSERAGATSDDRDRRDRDCGQQQPVEDEYRRVEVDGRDENRDEPHEAARPATVTFQRTARIVRPLAEIARRPGPDGLTPRFWPLPDPTAVHRSQVWPSGPDLPFHQTRPEETMERRGSGLHAVRRLDPDQVEASGDNRLRGGQSPSRNSSLSRSEHLVVVVEAVEVVRDANRIGRDRVRSRGALLPRRRPLESRRAA